MLTIKGKTIVIAMVASLSLFTAACGSSDEPTTHQETSAAPSEDAADTAANLVGPGCADYAEAVPEGAGSVAGMAQDPVATAASNNPLLTTLTAAVSGEMNQDVNLVDTLNGGEFTVFAPVDDAFAKLPKKAVKSLSTPAGAETLSSVLTYHVVAGQLGPEEVAGDLETVNGAKLAVEGSGDTITVGKDEAKVICGGVKTANATVYLIDTVLMPPS